MFTYYADIYFIYNDEHLYLIKSLIYICHQLT